MTIQIRTTQIPTIQILKNIYKRHLMKLYNFFLNAYLDLINIYNPLFSFFAKS